ncbi:Transcriptional regulatory protein BtsR [Neolewinella maritima]|uniref:Transcriptional regulatory protein BtsR n=1 Tax=Neolewinella maritima TaxID=1383882 RepID=A0ABN8F9U1_9BACT|nr:LytTR family DNA-binding domain-containing protein [Neolewinella maritima]CAH1001394.1 Transcriptional regulatory protein BtsR [Neolewinella maritima]
MSLRCLIVDDEQLARRLLRSYCARLPQLEVVGEASSAIEALPLLRTGGVDVLFLDIQMPEMSGLDLLRSLRQPPAVVLTTAYSVHALEAYDLDVVDYLLKPFGFDRFVRAVGRAEEQRPSAHVLSTRDPAPAYQLVKADYKIHRIAHTDIRYIESMREYVAYHTLDGKRTLTLGSLKQLEADLPDTFLRVHKSYIVARDKVTALEGNQLRLGDTLLPIGGSYREHVRQELFS